MSTRWLGHMTVDLAIVVGPCSQEEAWNRIEEKIRQLVEADGTGVEIETIEATSLEHESDAG